MNRRQVATVSPDLPGVLNAGLPDSLSGASGWNGDMAAFIILIGCALGFFGALWGVFFGGLPLLTAAGLWALSGPVSALVVLALVGRERREDLPQTRTTVA